MTKRTSLQGMWSSRFTFVLAVTGSAVGLGNIWKFPQIAGENGGGAFVMVYLACVFMIGLPTMMAEILMGRRGRRNPITTMEILGEEESGTKSWRYVGALGIIAGMLILSFYSVVAGWALAYIVKSASGAFSGVDAGAAQQIYRSHVGDWTALLGWHTLFIAMTIAVVARGVQRGLEVAVRILMPTLVILLCIILYYSIMHGNFSEALRFMFVPRWEALTLQGALIALGHAFFTLSVGMGAVMAYGAYLPAGSSIGSTALAVVLADTAIALLSAMVIFPIAFAADLDTTRDLGNIFITLPVAFESKGGAVLGTLFFMLLTLAAWTSSIGLVEPAVAWLTETRNMTRQRASVVLGIIIWGIGLATVFSFNKLADLQFLNGTLFKNLDHLASNIMLPLSGFLIIIFAGWVMCRNSSADELGIGVGLRYQIWRVFARYVAPIGIIFTFLYATGLLNRFFTAPGSV